MIIPNSFSMFPIVYIKPYVSVLTYQVQLTFKMACCGLYLSAYGSYEIGKKKHR